MKMKENDAITSIKKADVFDRACKEEEPSLCLHFTFALEEL
jgi:hypothetical protein